eukprot:TRINITY_DN57159_c0_g1_i1.p1 TRINITY_DN57159_c0_g1~~TRINITY_DN57159_c0_g1_i1.p1  ORF type:complete len:664 (-),score=41.58 TRINITY_DN57159_c0_g1_i1:174-2144(-)
MSVQILPMARTSRCTNAFLYCIFFFLPSVLCHFADPRTIYITKPETGPREEDSFQVVTTLDQGGFATCGAYEDLSTPRPATPTQLRETADRVGRHVCVRDQQCYVRLLGLKVSTQYQVYCTAATTIEGFGASEVSLGVRHSTGVFNIISMNSQLPTFPKFFTVEVHVSLDSMVWCRAQETSQPIAAPATARDLILSDLPGGKRNCIAKEPCYVTVVDVVPQSEYRVWCVGRTRPKNGVAPDPGLPWATTGAPSLMADRPITDAVRFVREPSYVHAFPTSITLDCSVNVDSTVVCGAFTPSNLQPAYDWIIGNNAQTDYNTHQVCLEDKDCAVTLSALPPNTNFDIWCFAFTQNDEGLYPSPMAPKVVAATTVILFEQPIAQDGSSKSTSIGIKMVMNVGVNGWCAAFAVDSDPPLTRQDIMEAPANGFAFCHKQKICSVTITGLQPVSNYEAYCITFTTVAPPDPDSNEPPEEPMVSEIQGPLLVTTSVTDGGGGGFELPFGFNKKRVLSKARTASTLSTSASSSTATYGETTVEEVVPQVELQPEAQQSVKVTVQKSRPDSIVEVEVATGNPEQKVMLPQETRFAAAAANGSRKMREEYIMEVEEVQQGVVDGVVGASGSTYTLMVSFAFLVFGMGSLYASRNPQHHHYYVNARV